MGGGGGGRSNLSKLGTYTIHRGGGKVLNYKVEVGCALLDHAGKVIRESKTIGKRLGGPQRGKRKIKRGKKKKVLLGGGQRSNNVAFRLTAKKVFRRTGGGLVLKGRTPSSGPCCSWYGGPSPESRSEIKSEKEREGGLDPLSTESGTFWTEMSPGGGGALTSLFLAW